MRQEESGTMMSRLQGMVSVVKIQPSETNKDVIFIRGLTCRRPTTISSKIVNASYKNNMEVPVFQIEEHSVWGATAMMLSELKDVLKMVF